MRFLDGPYLNPVTTVIGNVAAGSTFSALQSAGVVGMAGTTKAGLALAGGATRAAASEGCYCISS